MTPTELKTAALQRLRVLESGENPDPDDFQLIGTRYDGLHALLLFKQLSIWALNEDIPGKCQEPVISMLAALAVNDFPVSPQRKSDLIAQGALDLPTMSLAERQLRKALARPYIPTPQRSEYF